jgi:periplasmic divalent cation tolerance protein
MENIRVVFVTLPRDEADELAKSVVEERLAACVNIVPKIESYYWWNGKVLQDKETLLIFKTSQMKIEALISYVKENHPYDIPEIITFQLSEGLPDYINWVISETGNRE